MKTFAWSIFAAGVALTLAFAIISFEGGIIADATGGVGTLTPGQAVIGIGGLALILCGILLLIAAARRSGSRGQIVTSAP